MLLEVVAKADTFVGPLEGTVFNGQTHNTGLKYGCFYVLVVSEDRLTRLPGPP